MDTIKMREGSDHIKLGQALKAANAVDSGAEAKAVINDALVTVNGEVENRRGRKLHDGDVIFYDGKEIKIDGN